MSYSQERRVFDGLKSDTSPEAQQEYESVFNTLIERYNTTVYENRFIAGGAVEVFTYALLRSVGIEANLYGSQSRSGDILLPNNKLLSIKGVFTGGPSNVKLMNKQGGVDRRWKTAILFIISEVGVVYGTPDMVESEHVFDSKDGLQLHKKGLKKIMEVSSNIIPMSINRKPPKEMSGFAIRASML